jgi:hypothetical protein
MNVIVRLKPNAKRILEIHRGLTPAEAHEIAHVYRLLGHEADCIEIAADDRQRLKAAG